MQYEKPSLTLILGLPGSGKSRYVSATGYADHHRTTVINFDSLRMALGHVYHRSTEPHVNAMAYAMVRVAMHEGRDVVVDESITELHIAATLAEIAGEFQACLRIVHIDTPAAVCRARRVPNGFPEDDFNRKILEWECDGELIKALADCLIILRFGANERSGAYDRR